MPPEQHAILSASAAERWLHCPGSVHLTKNMPETTSSYAEEGSLAHAMAELKLRKKFTEPMGPKTYAKEMQKIFDHPLYTAEINRCTDEYADHITELAMAYPSTPFIAIEKRLDLTAFVPSGFGTADCILIYGDELYVVDYKHGQGVNISAENNPQMKLYALGALVTYRDVFTIRTVHTHIVQPRNGGVKTASLSADELLEWGERTVAPIAKKAFDGCEEYHSGTWCRWCKIAATCKTRKEETLAQVDALGQKSPNLLTKAEIGLILSKVDAICDYAKAVKEYAEKQILLGEDIPGWKLVEGRSTRQWDSQEAAFAALSAAGIDSALLWQRKPCSLSELEKLVGKKRFAEIAGAHIIKPVGKPTLAPSNDKRASYQPRPTAENDFKNEKE